MENLILFLYRSGYDARFRNGIVYFKIDRYSSARICRDFSFAFPDLEFSYNNGEIISHKKASQIIE